MQRPSSVCGAFAVLASLSVSSLAQSAAPMVTFAEGASTIVSGGRGYVATPGLTLRQCDIVRTGPRALVQTEFEDGRQIALGDDSRFAFGPAVEPYYLQSGWAKISVPKREPPSKSRLSTPYFDVLIDAGVAVLRVNAEGGQFFVEQGEAVALPGDGTRINVGAGRTYSRKPGQKDGAVSTAIDRAFVEGMPRPLRDTLPSMLARAKARSAPPKPVAADGPVDAGDWMKSVPELRPCIDDSVRDAQKLLRDGGFDVGPIDGILGPRTQAALREYQRQRQLAPSGRLDDETLRALDAEQRR